MVCAKLSEELRPSEARSENGQGTGLDTAQVCAQLDVWARTFCNSLFLPPEYHDEREIPLREDVLLDTATWLYHGTAISEGSCWFVSSETQETLLDGSLRYTSYVEALRAWHLSQWKGWRQVTLSIPRCWEVEAYLGSRATINLALGHSLAAEIHETIIAAICFKGHGGTVHIEVDASFWQLDVAVPFASNTVSPLN